MEVQYKYEKDEFIRGYRQVMKKSKVVKGYDIILYIGCIIGAFFLEGMFRSLLLLAGIIGIGGLLYQTYIKPKKIYEKVAMFQENYLVLIDDRGIEVRTSDASGLHPWENIKNIDSDKEFYFVEEGNGGFLFLPKRAFSKEAAEGFMRESKSRLKNKEI